jgi:hypothetical protein
MPEKTGPQAIVGDVRRQVVGGASRTRNSESFQGRLWEGKSLQTHWRLTSEGTSRKARTTCTRVLVVPPSAPHQKPEGPSVMSRGANSSWPAPARRSPAPSISARRLTRMPPACYPEDSDYSPRGTEALCLLELGQSSHAQS